MGWMIDTFLGVRKYWRLRKYIDGAWPSSHISLIVCDELFVQGTIRSKASFASFRNQAAVWQRFCSYLFDEWRSIASSTNDNIHLNITKKTCTRLNVHYHRSARNIVEESASFQFSPAGLGTKLSLSRHLQTNNSSETMGETGLSHSTLLQQYTHYFARLHIPE